MGTLVARPGLGPGSCYNSHKSGSGGGVRNGSVECLDGGEPLTLRRTGCGTEGAGLLGSEGAGGKLMGNMGAFMPMQWPAVKRLFPSPEG